MGGRPQMPPVSQYEQTLIELLFDIGPVVSLGMGGQVAISESDIGWYRLNRRCALTTAECATLRTLSRVYASAINYAHAKDAQAPWRPAQINRAEVAKGFAEWAERMKAASKE
jgi:hypothetical protein